MPTNRPLPLKTNVPAKLGWFDRGLAVVFVAASLLAMSANHADVDLWGHVRYGEDTLRSGLATTATYTYTAEGHQWINHENLSEILLAAGNSSIGPRGLLFAKTLLAGLVLFIFLRQTRRYGTSTITCGLLMLVLAMNLGDHWVLRPQLLSYVFFAILLWMLSSSFHGWQFHNRFAGFQKDRHKNPINLGYESRRLRTLWLVPVLFVAWTNSHGGFVAGLAIYLTYLAVRGIEARSCRGKPGRGIVGRFAMLGTVAIVATVLNPYGIRLHSWLLDSLGAARPEITEWHPPELSGWNSIPLWSAIGLFAFGLLFSRRSKDVTHVVVLMLMFWQSLAHQRHIPFFVMALVFWMHPHIQSALERFRFGGLDQRDAKPQPIAMRLALTAGLLFAATMLGIQLHDQHQQIDVARDEFPVGAIQYMADQKLSGKAVVTYNWAQYVLAAFALDDEPRESGIRLAFDGRFRTCYPQDVIDMHFDLILGNLGPKFRNRSLQSPTFDSSRVLHHKEPDLVLIRRSQVNSCKVLERESRNWVLLYQDSLAQLWGRRDRFGELTSPYYVAPVDRRVSSKEQTGLVPWPALPQHTDTPATLTTSLSN